MDGVHDLGGREGFGPIAVTARDPAFAEPWEGRVFAMTQSVGDGGSTIDWFRNLVELMPPGAYLSEPYFQKWLFTLLVELIQAGMLSRDEALTGKPERTAPPPPALGVGDVLARVRANATSFECPAPAAPAFAVGQTVGTRRHMPATHTRLPGYARGRTGRIIACHGAHVLPDRSARGERTGEHLYTVAFAATELWGEGADARDDVTLDLWESYLVRP